MMRRGCLSITQSRVQIPVGPAPMMSTVSFSVISDMRAAPKARGKHVAHKERLFVAHRIRNAVQSLVGIRHADVLGLTSVDAATQCPTAIGIGAIVHISVSAKEAFATKGFYVHRNPVAGPDRSDVRAHLLHDAYHFVPHRGSGQGTRHATVLDVQIAGANATERHADNGVAGSFNLGFGFSISSNFPCSI